MATTVQQELETVQAEIDRLTVIRDYLAQRAKATNGVRRPGRPRGARTQQGRVTIAEAARRALEKADGPMRTPALVDAARLEGATVKDADSLYKTLSRHDGFKKVGRGTWTIV